MKHTDRRQRQEFVFCCGPRLFPMQWIEQTQVLAMMLISYWLPPGESESEGPAAAWSCGLSNLIRTQPPSPAKLMSAQSVAATEKKKRKLSWLLFFADKDVFPWITAAAQTRPVCCWNYSGAFLQVFQRAHVSRGCLSVSAGCLLQELNTRLVAVLDAQAHPPPDPFLQANTQTHSRRREEPWISRGKQTLRNALSAPSRPRPLLNSTSVLRKRPGASLGECEHVGGGEIGEENQWGQRWAAASPTWQVTQKF